MLINFKIYKKELNQIFLDSLSIDSALSRILRIAFLLCSLNFLLALNRFNNPCAVSFLNEARIYSSSMDLRSSDCDFLAIVLKRNALFNS